MLKFLAAAFMVRFLLQQEGKMQGYIYSAECNSFFPVVLKQSYIEASSWPKDGVYVNEHIVREFSSEPPTDKVRVAGEDGFPKWQKLPLKTEDELIIAANYMRLDNIKVANMYINERQWPSKLALGRLSVGDKINFELWLDYLDALEIVDISNAPDINWPMPPVNQAS